MKSIFKGFAGALALCALFTFGADTARANGYPTKPVSLIVAYPPGGTTDTLARILASRLSTKWKQPVIVENRVGAGGIIGTEAVAKAAPNGYTLLLGVAATHAVNPAVFKNLPYDYIGDFTPISMAGVVPGVIAVKADSPATSLAELVRLGKRTSLNYGTPSVGSMSHLVGELFRQLSGIKMEHIPYKGSAPALTDLLGGHIQVLVDNLPPSLPYIREGKIRALAVTSPQRSPELPDVPTMIELGYSDFDLQGWFAVFGPKNLPKELASKISADIAEVLIDPAVKGQLASAGINSQSSTPSELADRIRRDSARMIDVAKHAGISLTP